MQQAPGMHPFRAYDTLGTQCGDCWGWYDDPRHTYTPDPWLPRLEDIWDPSKPDRPWMPRRKSQPHPDVVVYTVTEAAGRLGITVRQLEKLARMGVVPGAIQPMGPRGQWRFNAAILNRMIDENHDYSDG